jgi:hypothetical protein
MPARGSPWLFAACHVLHRLLAPRHPPDALVCFTHMPNRSEFRDQNSEVRTLFPSPDRVGICSDHPRTKETQGWPHHNPPASPRKQPWTEPTDPQSFRPPSRRRPELAPKPPHEDGNPLPLHHVQYQVSELRNQKPENPFWHLISDLWLLARLLPVEANGIEPMTSCLQSRRSPN